MTQKAGLSGCLDSGVPDCGPVSGINCVKSADREMAFWPDDRDSNALTDVRPAKGFDGSETLESEALIFNRSGGSDAATRAIET